MKKIGSLSILLASALLILIQKVNAFTLDIENDYFDGLGLLTGNRAEINFEDNNNLGYGAFFIGSGFDTNTTLIIRDSRGNPREINCNKQLKGYYTIMYNSFLMLGLDRGTVEYTNQQGLTQDVNFITGGLFYECTRNGSNAILTGIYGYIERTYGSNNKENTHRIRAGIDKETLSRANISPLELVYSNSSGYTSETLSGEFYSSLTKFGKVLPRAIGDIWIGNADEYKSGTYVVKYENFTQDGIDIRIITSTPHQDVQVDMVGQYEDSNGNTHPHNDSFTLATNSSVPTNINRFFGFGGFYGYRNTGYKRDYREFSGTITLTITGVTDPQSRSIKFRIEGGEPCLSGRNNNYFITPDFWELNWHRLGPTDAQIKCAIFGYEDNRYNESNGAGYQTAYTKGRTNYTSGTACSITNVIRSGSLPTPLQANTIYVLTSTGANVPNSINIPSCTAIISKTEVEINFLNVPPKKTYYGIDTTLRNTTLNLNGEHIVLDNISVKTNGNGININSGNNTLNMVKVYNGNIGISLNNVSHVLLNNIQSFNNNVGIQLNDGNTNAINNTQVYRNNLGVLMTGTSQTIIYNSSIYRNKTGLKVLGSNYNIFNKINLYSNVFGSSGHNLYIETGLINTGTNIYQSSNNILLFTGDTGVILNGRTTVLISGRNWISLWYPLKSTYGYECIGGTTGRCLVDGGSGNINYICTGTIMYEDLVTDTLFTANGLTVDELPRNLSISGNKITINITKLSGDDENTITYTESTNTGVNIIWWSTGNNDTEGYYIFYNNESLIDGEFHPDNNGNYNVNFMFEYIEYTGYGTMEPIYKEFAGTTNDLDTLGNTLCQFDGGFSTGGIINEQYYNKPQIIGNTGLLSEYSNTGNINMFSYSAGLGAFSDSWDKTTNPQYGTNQYYIYNRHAAKPNGIGKPGSSDTINNYSYGISIPLQVDVLFYDGSEGGKIKKPHGQNENYYIGSHVPKVSITSSIKTITKINYIVSGDSANSFGQTKYDIASLIGNHFIRNLTTVLTGQDYSWLNGPVWTGILIGGWTNQITGINLGTSTILYLKTGDLATYYILLQVYGDSYFSSHKYIQALSRQRLKLTVYPTNTCRYDEFIILTGNRNTPNDTGANVTGLDVTGIIDIRPIYSSVSRITPTTGYEISHTKLQRTGWTTRTIQIPCNTGQICGTKPMIKTSWIQYVQDMRGFISNPDTFREIYRDLKGPSINVITGSVYECSTKTVSVKLQDQCIGNSGFKISGENFVRGGIVAGTTHYNETGFIPLITNGTNSYTPKNYYISSGFIGRTGSTASTPIIKTLNITARDKFNNETTGTFTIKINDIKPRLQTGKNAASAVLLLSGKRITGYEEQHIIHPINILGAEEKTGANANLVTCGTADLRIQNFGCENYLTGIIGADNIFLTVMPKAGEDGIGFKSGLICRIQIVDNENSIVTGYIKFNINTIHKPLYQDPLIVSGTKYIEYENEELINYYENKNRTDRTGRDNEELKIKYTSGDTVYLDIGEVNEYVEYYHIECSGDYYTNTGLYSETASEWKSYYDDIVYSGDTKLLIFSGRKNKCNTGQITGIKVTIRNGSEEGVGLIGKVQITTGDADYIFYDNIRPETTDMDSGVNNSVNNPYDEDAIIIADGQTLTNNVQVKDRSEIDHRPSISGYTEGFYIQKTRARQILSLRILSGYLEEIRDGEIRVDNNEITPISPRPQRPGSDPITDPVRPIDPNLERIETKLVRKRRKQLKADMEGEISQHNRLTTGPILDIRGTLQGNKNNDFEEKRIGLKIGTGLLHDFSINDSKIKDIITRYRFTNKNPIFVKGRQVSTGPEGDISRLIVQIETGEINTGNLTFELWTAKQITQIDCTGYNDLGHFSDCEIKNGEHLPQQPKRICILWKTGGIMPICSGNRNIVGNGYTYSGIYHRNASFSRKYTVSYNIFSGEDTGYYFSSDHTGEWEFYGKVSLYDTDQRYNDEYVMIKLVDRKTPFKVGIKGQEMEYYGTIFDAVTSTSGDNLFFFYITHPQRINIEGGLKSGMIGDISYEINFNTGVADEFYYITGESTVNGYKESIGIKRPTFNYANPKGYLFNFPDYTYYE